MPMPNTYAGSNRPPLEFNGRPFIHHVGTDGVTVTRAFDRASIGLMVNRKTGEDMAIVFLAETEGMTGADYAEYCSSLFTVKAGPV